MLRWLRPWCVVVANRRTGARRYGPRSFTHLGSEVKASRYRKRNHDTGVEYLVEHRGNQRVHTADA